MKYNRLPLFRRLPVYVATFLMLVSIVGCAHTSWGRDPHADESLKYYYFIKASLKEYEQDDEDALTNMARASSLDNDSFYLKQETARLYARLGDLSTALKYAQTAIDLNPTSPEPRLFAARVAGSAGMWEAAATYYQDVLRLEPNNREALTLLGALYAETGRPDQAEATFKKLVATDPDYLSYYYLGRFYNTTGRTKEAISAFNTTLKKNPDFTTALGDLALLYEETGDWKNAEKSYRELIKARPDASMPKARLARLLLKNGRKAEADALLGEVEGLSLTGGSNDPAQLLIGRIYLEQGLYDEAAEEFETVLKLEPDNDLTRYLLARTQLELGRRDQALASLRQIPKGGPVYGDAQLLLTSITVGDGSDAQLKAALEIVANARKNQPDDPRLWMFQATILEDLEDLQTARKILTEAGRKFPQDADFRFRLGVVEQKLDNVPATIAAMREAVRLNPLHAEALNFLAYTWAERGENLTEALALAERADQLKPGSGYIIDTLGWIHYQLGDYKKALNYLEQAAALSGHDPVVMDHLGDALERLGRPAEALKAYRQALGQDLTDQKKLEEDLNAKINRLSN